MTIAGIDVRAPGGLTAERAAAAAGSPAWWEFAFVCAAMFLSTSALLPLLVGSGVTPADAPDDPASRYAWILILLLLVVAAARCGSEILHAVGRNPALAAVVYLAIASTIWSPIPGTTLKYSLEVALTTLLGLYVGVRFGVSRLIAMASWTTAAILFLSIVFAVGVPHYGLDHERGNVWRGIFTTKNELARVMVTGFVVWAVRLLARETRRGVGIVMLVGFAVTIVESGSRTGQGVAGLMLLVLLLASLMRHDDGSFVAVKGVVVCAIALVAALCVVNLRVLLALVGSDYSLTGRSGIWGAVWKAIEAHPWLGYGFDGFWRGAVGPSYEVFRAAGTVTPHSHNGFLDLLLALGFVGLVAFAVAYVTIWRRALGNVHTAQGAARLFPVAYLSLLLLYNLTESSLLSSRSLEWILLTALAAALAPARDVLADDVPGPGMRR